MSSIFHSSFGAPTTKLSPSGEAESSTFPSLGESPRHKETGLRRVDRRTAAVSGSPDHPGTGPDRTDQIVHEMQVGGLFPGESEATFSLRAGHQPVPNGRHHVDAHQGERQVALSGSECEFGPTISRGAGHAVADGFDGGVGQTEAGIPPGRRRVLLLSNQTADVEVDDRVALHLLGARQQPYPGSLPAVQVGTLSRPLPPVADGEEASCSAPCRTGRCW